MRGAIPKIFQSTTNSVIYIKQALKLSNTSKLPLAASPKGVLETVVNRVRECRNLEIRLNPGLLE